MEILCPWESAQHLIFSSNVPTLLYYSHFVAILAAVIFGFVLFFRARQTLVAKVFLTTILFFIGWAIIDVLLWASDDPGLVLFYWGLQILLEMLLYVSAFYFAYVFIAQKDLSLLAKNLLAILVLPIIVLLPTDQLLPAIDITYCDAAETPFVIIFTYATEILLGFLILFSSFRSIHKKKDRRKEIALFTLGTLIFLFSFSSGNIIGSITEDWELAQMGLFGMPIFIALLVYSVVRFKAFNVKAFGAQALVVTIWVLVGSLLFLNDLPTMRVVLAITLLTLIPFGILLIRSVRKEIELRTQLEEANKRQQETLRFITHEVKGYLTDGAAAFDAILTNTYGTINDDMRSMLNEAMVKNRNAIREIQNFLRIADFKTGKVSYARAQFDFKRDLESALHPIEEHAVAKNLIFSKDILPGDYTMVGDTDQLLNHVVGNLVNNSINYTQTGSVSVHLERTNDSILFSVKDTGVGLSDEDKAVLFTEGGHGKESRAVNPHSTGYGLYIASQIVLAHKGRIWAESGGRGKGSTFFVELPVPHIPENLKK